jgi:hypothetical protein
LPGLQQQLSAEVNYRLACQESTQARCGTGQAPLRAEITLHTGSNSPQMLLLD